MLSCFYVHFDFIHLYIICTWTAAILILLSSNMTDSPQHLVVQHVPSGDRTYSVSNGDGTYTMYTTTQLVEAVLDHNNRVLAHGESLFRASMDLNTRTDFSMRELSVRVREQSCQISHLYERINKLQEEILEAAANQPQPSMNRGRGGRR